MRTARSADLDAHLLARVARFKRPKRYLVVDELPKNSYGKILKTELRERLDERFLRKYGARFFCSDTGREREYLFAERPADADSLDDLHVGRFGHGVGRFDQRDQPGKTLRINSQGNAGVRFAGPEVGDPRLDIAEH